LTIGAAARPRAAGAIIVALSLIPGIASTILLLGRI
jgi:hypothetical protein